MVESPDRGEFDDTVKLNKSLNGGKVFQLKYFNGRYSIRTRRLLASTQLNGLYSIADRKRFTPINSYNLDKSLESLK